ncbi:hypothetical protein FLK61_40080 [Paenalkalicoccus suaedae]|uniref:Uncharacterized protein n=1 Tax=Paenalkalicoccus suaedae TaxID=2592382 RepID=A0A859FI78_9BACI|nr:hypothetical protein [Paenalkalicoccus suaedae]QKS72811.1 hypothetical protein FLK61_40080 [Paenalkalicoccus suaedae]
MQSKKGSIFVLLWLFFEVVIKLPIDLPIYKKKEELTMVEISRFSQPVAKPVKPQSQDNATKKEAPVEKPKTEEYVPSARPNVKEMTPEERDNYISNLRKQSEQHFESLKNLVKKMLEKQGLSYQDFVDGNVDFDKIEVDDETRAEAAAAIADDGPLGAEATSERIVNFAIALSGGDVEKLGILRGAIDDGFKAVKDIFGELPEVSKKTYDLIQEKLNAWEKAQKEPAE